MVNLRGPYCSLVSRQKLFGSDLENNKATPMVEFLPSAQVCGKRAMRSCGLLTSTVVLSVHLCDAKADVRH